MLTEKISSLCQAAAQQLGYEYPSGVVIDQPPAHIVADAAVNIAMQLVKSAGKPPRAIAEEFAAALRAMPEIAAVEIAGPGFLNITLSEDLLLGGFDALLHDPRQGVSEFAHGKVIIDYGGPNVAKPLHVGHLRSSVIGEAVKHIARFAGDHVDGDIHLGDWGTPMGMLIAELQDQPDVTITMDLLQELYPKAAARFKEDEDFKRKAQQATVELQQGNPQYTALWEQFVTVSKAAIKENMDRLDVTFELWNGESTVHGLIAPMLDQLQVAHYSEESEGATIIPLSEDLPPLLLIKSDGAFLYSTTDMATLVDRVAQGYTKAWYVVDQRQKLHFQQVFQAARKTGIVPAEMELEHFGFGTVNGPDGRPFKTRNGGAMQLKDLLDLAYTKAAERMAEVGVGKDYPEAEQQEIIRSVAIASLKFADLINHRASDYSFDTERFMSFEGKTGPYLLYTATRINSIFRKLGGDQSGAKLTQLGAQERPLVLRLMQFSDAVTQSYHTGQPHILCEYLYQLASAYNHFYHSCNIVQETDAAVQSGWIALSQAALAQLKLGLSLLAIPVPERM